MSSLSRLRKVPGRILSRMSSWGGGSHGGRGGDSDEKSRGGGDAKNNRWSDGSGKSRRKRDSSSECSSSKDQVYETIKAKGFISKMIFLCSTTWRTARRLATSRS